MHAHVCAPSFYGGRTLHLHTLFFKKKIKCHFLYYNLQKTWKLLTFFFVKCPLDVSNKNMKKKYDNLVTKSRISISFPMKVGKMCGCTYVVCDQPKNARVHAHRTHVLEVFLHSHAHVRPHISEILNPPFENQIKPSESKYL